MGTKDKRRNGRQGQKGNLEPGFSMALNIFKNLFYFILLGRRNDRRFSSRGVTVGLDSGIIGLDNEIVKSNYQADK